MANFARRVLVFSPAGDWTFTVHPERAKELVASGDAEACAPQKKQVRAIRLLKSTAHYKRGPCSTVTIRSYMGWRSTYREALQEPKPCGCGGVPECPRCGGEGVVMETVSRTLTLKRIPTVDHRIFLLSVLDTLSPQLKAQAEEMLKAELVK